MRFTNELGLPEPDFKALIHSDYDLPPGHISISRLISPPRKVLLERRHDDEIVVDCVDQMRMMLGTAVHYYTERFDGHDTLAEERISMPVMGWNVSGKLDLYDGKDEFVIDRKTTSVFAFGLGVKDEWEQQLNCYAHLLRHCGFGVKGARILAYMLDWKSYDAKYKADYPQKPIQMVPIALWEPDFTQAFIEERVTAHASAIETYHAHGEAGLPLCSSKERWERPSTWAAKKPANQKATRVFRGASAEYECRAFAAEKGGMEAILRPGEQVRCARFCRARPFCSQADSLGVMPPEGEDD